MSRFQRTTRAPRNFFLICVILFAIFWILRVLGWESPFSSMGYLPIRRSEMVRIFSELVRSGPPLAAAQVGVEGIGSSLGSAFARRKRRAPSLTSPRSVFSISYVSTPIAGVVSFSFAGEIISPIYGFTPIAKRCAD